MPCNHTQINSNCFVKLEAKSVNQLKKKLRTAGKIKKGRNKRPSLEFELFLPVLKM